MKIQTINFIDNYYKNNKLNDKSYFLSRQEQYDKIPVLKQFPIGYVKINFKGRAIPKLWEEYNWYINNDKTPAIFSFLKIKETPEVMDKFLNTILETPDRSKELISSIVYHPRETGLILEGLKKVLPQNSLNLMTFMYNSPYNQSYTKFMEWKLESAKSIEDLLRIRPDWKGDVLLQKYSKLKLNASFEIGNIPKDIPRKHLSAIVAYLNQYREYGPKTKKDIDSLTLDNRKYEFAYFTEGKSDKSVFGIFTPEGKKYVLKMSDIEHRSLDRSCALGTLAKIDSYLTYNRSRNSAPFCYYNHDKNFSIYKYIEHVSTNKRPSQLTEILDNIPDFKALGLDYNDTVGYKNFFLMDRSSDVLNGTEGFEQGLLGKEWVSVDNDYVTYSNIMQPYLNQFHKMLPNDMQNRV